MSDYVFSLDKFHIDDTRSHHNDTNIVGFAVKVNADMHGPIFKNTGDVNNGDHSLDMQLGPIPINGPDDIVTIVYQMFNNGHDHHPNEAQLGQLMEAVMPTLPNAKSDDPDNPTSGDENPGASMGDGSGDSGWEDIAKQVGETILTFGFNKIFGLFRSCDGIVAANKVTLFQEDLHSRTRTADRTTRKSDNFRAKVLNYGAPCNDSGSNYTVFWSVKRVA